MKSVRRPFDASDDSDKLEQCISALFDTEDHESALSMLDDPPSNTLQDALRLQLAAVRYSGGSLKRLQSAIELCKRDFRDLLMYAGLGEDISAHLAWVPRRFRERDAENWMNGRQIEGVEFGPNEDVWKLTSIQRKKKDAKIISLAGLEPVPVYLVRYSSGKEQLVAQHHLIRREVAGR